MWRPVGVARALRAGVGVPLPRGAEGGRLAALLPERPPGALRQHQHHHLRQDQRLLLVDLLLHSEHDHGQGLGAAPLLLLRPRPSPFPRFHSLPSSLLVPSPSAFFPFLLFSLSLILSSVLVLSLKSIYYYFSFFNISICRAPLPVSLCI